MRINSAQSGMTLIQMAGILLIISIMMVPFFQIQSLTKKNEIRAQSTGQVTDVSKALVQFALENGRYPLPANPVFSLNNPSSGEEATSMLGATESDRDTNVRTEPLGECGIAAPNDKLICEDGIGNPFVAGSAENRIIIGTIPYTVLGLTPAQSLDEYGNKMTYAVTYGLTKDRTFSNDKGNIRVQDQGGGCDIFMEGANPSTQAHFVVVSHGKNRSGAFPATGGAHAACTSAAVQSADERENCNDNAVFRLISARINADCTKATPTFTQRMPGMNTANSFDDLVAFRTVLSAGNWTAQRTVDGNNSVYQSYLGYRNGKENVIIGTAPGTATKKPYAGQVQLEGTDQNVKVDGDIQTQYLCTIKYKESNNVRTDYKADACFRVKFLTQENSSLTLGMPVNAMVPNDFEGSNRIDARAGYADTDRGMLRIDKRKAEEAQSPNIKGFDTGTNTVLDRCGPNGAKGIDSSGRLLCN